MEFVNNAAFLVFIGFFLTDCKKKRKKEGGDCCGVSRSHTHKKKNQLPVRLKLGSGSDQGVAGRRLANDASTLVFCAVLSHRLFPLKKKTPTEVKRTNA